MALEGSIKDFSLADIFQLIGIQRKTGILTLLRKDQEVKVSFLNGMVVHADSKRGRLDDRLGSVLVKTGKLTQDQLEGALRTQKQTLKKLGHVLVETGMARPEDLREALGIQITQIVYRLFRWKDGDYHFEQDVSVDYDKENFTPMSAESILMEGMRMIDEWPVIERKITSFDMVFERVELEAEQTPVVDDGPVEEPEEGSEDDFDLIFGGDDKKAKDDSPSGRIKLTREEALVYDAIDGKAAVQELVDKIMLSEFEICRALYDLSNRNLIVSASTPEKSRPGKRKAKAGGSGALANTVRKVAPLLLGGLAVGALGAGVSRVNPLNQFDRLTPRFQQQAAFLEPLTRLRLQRAIQAVDIYILAKGSYPKLPDLVEAGLLSANDLQDAEGHEFNLEVSSDERSTRVAISAVTAAGSPPQRLERAYLH